MTTFATRQDFIAAASTAALAASAKSGLPAGITVAQAALESGWGQSGLSINANNFFGIKAYGAEPYVSLETREVSPAGMPYQIIAKFRKFDSMEQCFEVRDSLILNMACYAEARAAKKAPLLFAQALAMHWATDPNYAARIRDIYMQYSLAVIK